MYFVAIETTDVRRILHDVEEKLSDVDATDSVRENFTHLISLLDSPLFSRLVCVDDALSTLRDISRKHPIQSNDFELDNGELKLSNVYRRKLTLDDSRHSGSTGDAQYLSNTLTLADSTVAFDGTGSLSNLKLRETIVLDKPDGPGIGLGFGIVGLRTDQRELGVFVQDIQPGGVADR